MHRRLCKHRAPANSRDTPCCIPLPCLHSCNSAHIFSLQIHGITGKFTQHSNKLGWRIKGKTNKVSKREKSSEIYTEREKSASSLLLTQASKDEASEIHRAASTDFCHVEKELSLSQTLLLSPNKGVLVLTIPGCCDSSLHPQIIPFLLIITCSKTPQFLKFPDLRRIDSFIGIFKPSTHRSCGCTAGLLLILPGSVQLWLRP